jgi:hypothetical protein
MLEGGCMRNCAGGGGMHEELCFVGMHEELCLGGMHEELSLGGGCMRNVL